MTTLAAPQIGSTAAELLFRVTQLGLIAKAPRVRLWEGTLAKAFQEYALGNPDCLCALPFGTASANGETSDTASSILAAFDTWLGKDLVWKCYEVAASGTVSYE
jgi:hypothetical protein